MPARRRQVVLTATRTGARADRPARFRPTPAGEQPGARADLPVRDRSPSHAGEQGCCPHYHEAVEFIGKRWTGAIVQVLLAADRPLRFSQIAQAVPELSDRLLSERIKELEARGLVRRTVHDGPGVRVEYALTEAGEQLERVVIEIQAWALRWLR